MTLELVHGHGPINPAMVRPPIPDEMPPATPLSQTIDSLLSYANHIEGEHLAILELANATYTEHFTRHRGDWAVCLRDTCKIARTLLPY